MHCWKTVNVTKEIGTNRMNLISLITGLLTFLILYLSFSIVHQNIMIKDYGIFPFLIGLILLPLFHKLMHLMPLILFNKRVKVKWRMIKKIFPIVNFHSVAKLTKQTFIVSLLAPTLLISLPGLICCYLFQEHYLYFALFSSVNIAMSLPDFIYIVRIMQAPKKCVVENADDGYDILVQYSHLS